ncbi:MAG: bifunctional germination protease/germinant receptor pseudoprotease CspBA [Terrisporobacter sp.]|uniref:bifunctional germination protease/germinant receptor pseudoprotease CspBA n=1 Tax=Terrisporobacter sp. TaxID=1965305 RepID=UPI002FCA795C
MIKIDYEVIVKYNGDIMKLEKELNVSVEILSPIYAIISSDDSSEFDKLLNYTEIEYIEKPFILETQDAQSFSSTGITSFKNRTSLTGKGTILGLIDSGIDYTLPIFKDKNGKSKILYYWDQSISGNPPNGFKEGTLYNNDDINNAINGEMNIPISITATHGTHVAGISAGIANEASLIVVRVGNRQTDYYSRSTEFMRAIKFILDKALELKSPVAINMSYGSNEGSHRGLSLFEQYIDDMCLFWKNNIVVAAGNNRAKGGHKQIKLANKVKEVELIIGENERLININIWPSFADDFNVYLVNPSNQKTQSISLTSGEIKNSIGSTKIKGYFYPIAPYSLQRRVTFQLTTNSTITPGIWKIVFAPTKIVDGNINIYLPTSEGLSKDTRFLTPTTERTVTVPGTASRVITVGSYNSKSDIISIFSGEGDYKSCVFKPDILSPGEDINSYLPGGSEGVLSGTSMATPHVTGVCALFLQWGIVNRNDEFLYSAKLKALLLKSARRSSSYSYPNNLEGYGFLNLSTLELDQLIDINSEMDYIYRKKRKHTQSLMKRKLSLHLFREGRIRPGVNVLFKPGFEESIKNLGYDVEFDKLSDDYGIVYINDNNRDLIERISSNPLVTRLESLTRLTILGTINQSTKNGVNANEEIGVDFFKNNPNLSLTGKGVVISIVASGIDYLHPDFIYPDGTSKIIYLWDQTKEGNPPKGYNIGTEYTREQINEAIAKKDGKLSKDEEGYGTIFGGICAGLGNVNPEYAGVAEDTELIVVKMDKINGYYNNAMEYIGQRYAYEKSYELKRPIVINYVVGTNSLVGLSTRTTPYKTFFRNGVCLVSAVGDEGNTQTHTSGKILFSGDIQEIELEVANEEENIEIQIWINKPDTAKVVIVSPTGEESKIIEVSDYNITFGKFDLESTPYSITYIYPTTFSGQQQSIVNLFNVKKGIWKIRLIGDYITNGIYNMYLPNRVFLDPQTKFRNPIPLMTVNYPATYNDNIAVGAYDSINRGLWQGSSRGPTISGLQKPDIVAPGVNIIGPYPGGGYATITGTSPSTCYTAGCVAMFMQYILVDHNYPSKAFVQSIRTLFSAGAKRIDGTSYPNDSTGYGVLNLKGTFDVFR